MKYYLLAAVAATAIAAPAQARDGQVYFGIEGGILFPKDQDADASVNFTTTQTVPTTPTVAGPADFDDEDAFGIDYKKGLDLDAIIGYDFGMFRLEGELGWKRAKLNEFEVDNGFISALNTGLNRPDRDVAPDPVDTLPALSAADFDLDGKTTVLSGMINALVDFGNEDGLSFYGGAGFGRARVKFEGESDSAWAYQLIAGVRYALSDNIDLGLKYRYFRTGKLDLADDVGLAFDGNPETVVVGTTAPVTTVVTTDAVVFGDFEQK
ncbi:MAG TPA: outer membrane beta-barrel protein, partial [Sphingomicrobium sp.]|nr:outer membrane beta-barrel protein [Sphingomicrobium sp.]